MGRMNFRTQSNYKANMFGINWYREIFNLLIVVFIIFPPSSSVESFSPKSTKSISLGKYETLHYKYYSFPSYIGSRNKRGLLRAKETRGEEDSYDNELKLNIPRLLKCVADGDASDLEPLLSEIYQSALKSHSCNMENSLTETIPESISQEMQPPIPAQLASMRRFMRTSPIDIEHEGRFRVFSDDPNSATSLSPTLVFSMDQPLSFIRENLSYQCDSTKKGGMLCDNSETVVWCVQKNLNLEYTSVVLDDMPLAQLHMGSFPDCEVELEEGTIEKLESLGVLQDWGSHTKPNKTKEVTMFEMLSQDLDVIRTLLSFHADSQSQTLDSSIHLQGHHTLVKLIDCAVKSARTNLLGNSNEPHLVICAHSMNASIVAAALSTWKQQKLRSSSYKPLHVEDLLHTAVTVVTIGAVCQKFCDGPAYIHISMYDDNLAEQFGVTQKNQIGGGRNAVYLQAWSPYEVPKDDITSLTDHDSHNMNACAIQFLCLVMRINGITSFRDLYNSARYIDPRSILDINPRNFAIDYARYKLGDLVIAPNMDDELLPAMIRATGGDQWLWNPIPQDLDESEFLPDSQEAKVYLEEYFGYSTYEEIYESCCRNMAQR